MVRNLFVGLGHCITILKVVLSTMVTQLTIFSLERGVKQTDRLSPYLFVVTVETLALVIRHRDNWC